MDNPTPSLRAQGIQALREGNVDPAVDLLARAVMADPQDAEAQAFLGVAYSQKGLHAQAKRALETAVELQPRNAHHRFNLGVALEQAGDRPGAASAYRDTLQIDPEHAQARALAAQGAAPPSAATPRAAPAETPSPTNAPWLRGQQSSPGAAPGGPLGPVQAGPPGTVPCPKCHQWSKPGMSCEWCSAPLRAAPGPMTGRSFESASGSMHYAPVRPFGVSLLVVLYDLGAICSIIIGVGIGIGAAGASARPGGTFLGTMLAAFAAATMVMALVMLTVSYFLWHGFNWARIVLIVLLALAMLGQLAQLLSGRNPVVPLLELLVSVLFLVLLNTRQTREFCTR